MTVRDINNQFQPNETLASRDLNDTINFVQYNRLLTKPITYTSIPSNPMNTMIDYFGADTASSTTNLTYDLTAYRNTTTGSYEYVSRPFKFNSNINNSIHSIDYEFYTVINEFDSSAEASDYTTSFTSELGTFAITGGYYYCRAHGDYGGVARITSNDSYNRNTRLKMYVRFYYYNLVCGASLKFTDGTNFVTVFDTPHTPAENEGTPDLAGWMTLDIDWDNKKAYYSFIGSDSSIEKDIGNDPIVQDKNTFLYQGYADISTLSDVKLVFEAETDAHDTAYVYIYSIREINLNPSSTITMLTSNDGVTFTEGSSNNVEGDTVQTKITGNIVSGEGIEIQSNLIIVS